MLYHTHNFIAIVLPLNTIISYLLYLILAIFAYSLTAVKFFDTMTFRHCITYHTQIKFAFISPNFKLFDE